MLNIQRFSISIGCRNYFSVKSSSIGNAETYHVTVLDRTHNLKAQFLNS